MNLQPIRYHICSLDHGEGILLVDVESETIPRTDARGNPLYYCLAGHHIFSIERGEREKPIRKLPPLSSSLQ